MRKMEYEEEEWSSETEMLKGFERSEKENKRLIWPSFIGFTNKIPENKEL